MDKYNDLAFQKRLCYSLIYKLRPESRDFVLKALKAAEKWHKPQKRPNAGRSPLIIHIYRVMIILIEDLKIKDRELLAAGVLHDVVEDCGVTVSVLKKSFGNRVASIVEAESQNLYPDRKKYIEHLKRESKDVKLVKAADRLDNIRTVIHRMVWKDDKRVQYLIETEKYMLPIAKEVDGGVYRKTKSVIDRLKAQQRLNGIYNELSDKDRTGYIDTEWHRPNPNPYR